MGSAAAINGASMGKIMVRSTNWIGDAVMTTPALGDLRAAFPRAEIVLVANPIVAELFSGHPHCDRILVYDKKGRHRGMAGLFSFCGSLRRERFDAAILFQNAMGAALMACMARIPVRAGYRTDGRGVLLTHGVSVGRRERSLHHTDYYRNMLDALGIRGGDGRLNLSLTPGETQWADSVLQGGGWAAINPGAAYGSAKRWYPERFAQVADALIERYGLKVLMTGSTGEAPLGSAIAQNMNKPVLDLMGKTTVRQMAALLSRCALVITNDSGPMHIAAALDLPIVALFGPTDARVTSPKGTFCQIVRHEQDCAPCLKRTCPTDHRCMRAISSDDVIRAVEELFKKSIQNDASASGNVTKKRQDT